MNAIAWDTTSVEAMERTAMDQADGSCSKRIGDYWLEVVFDGEHLPFRYKWGKNWVTREDAIAVHPAVSIEERP